MKRPAIFIALNILIIIALSVVQVVAANSISTTGIELSKIQDEISSLQKQNEVTHEQVLTLSSLTSIASRASTMGFEESKSTLVISQPLPLARR
ncbi:hypothetical protein BH09PAT1_BH09PAT1_3870 [soil metagenome]